MMFVEKEVRDMMNNTQEKRCAMIIHSAAVTAGGIGALPVPGSDAAGLLGVQTAMVLALAEVFGIPLTQTMAQHAAKQAIVSSAGKLIATNLTKMIPVAGSIICGSVAAGLTEAFGWQQAREFAACQQIPG